MMDMYFKICSFSICDISNIKCSIPELKDN